MSPHTETATSRPTDSEKTSRTQRWSYSKTSRILSSTLSIEISWVGSHLSDTTIESRSRKSQLLSLIINRNMDDKEKIAMLESDKVRLQVRLNQYEALMMKLLQAAQMVSKHNDSLIDLINRSDKLLARNLEFMEKVPWQYRMALLSGILIGITLLDFLQSILEK